MENREEQILAEIRKAIVSIKAQLESLEDMVAFLSLKDEAGAEEVDAIDLDIADVMAFEAGLDRLEETVEEVVGESVEETVGEAVADTVEETVEEVVEEMMEETVEEVVEEMMEEAVEEAVEEIVEETVEEAKAGPILDAAMETVRTAVIDTMTAREAWRTDMPGSPVKDIRSAISLNDRILFINTLFDEDPVLFQSILTKVNSMSGLEEVVEFLAEERPSWNMESDEVYRFMMAVRRRIQ